MNSGFSEFLRAAPRDGRDVFLGAATRLGTPEQNAEKTSGLHGHPMYCVRATLVDSIPTGCVRLQ
jgi:hypothetical protein